MDFSGSGDDYNFFYVWKDWEVVKVIRKQKMTYEDKLQTIRTLRQEYNIPIHHVCGDAVGTGEDLMTSEAMTGSVPFKANYAPFNTTSKISVLDATGSVNSKLNHSDYKDLRSQCIFYFAKKVNQGETKITIEDSEVEQQIIQEMLLHIQEDHPSKIAVISKSVIKEDLGRSPDALDGLYQRSYFDLREKYTKAEVYADIEMTNDIFDDEDSNL